MPFTVFRIIICASLVAGILAVHLGNQRLVAQPEPTPTAISTTPAGAEQQDSPDGPAPTPRVILHPAPGQSNEVYKAGGDDGFASWVSDAGWREQDGMLVSDGASPDTEVTFTFAPTSTESLTDFAVEAEIRSEGAAGDGFGLTIESGADEPGYAVGIRKVQDESWQAAIAALDDAGELDGGENAVVSGQPLAEDDDWHLFRVNVKGSLIQFLFDGLIVATATDVAVGGGGRVGLWSDGVEIEVRHFRLMAMAPVTGASASPAASPASAAPPTATATLIVTQQTVTPAPTISEPTVTPSPTVPAPTATATIAEPTVTPTVEVTEPPAATQAPEPLPSTALDEPSDGDNPTIDPTAQPAEPAPSGDSGGFDEGDEIPIEPVDPLPAIANFAYSDWSGGWRQNSSAFYGRPWTVIYGAFSQFPAASLTFALQSAPLGTAVLEVTGLDDEWAGNCQIAVLVNGFEAYQGPSPWTSYSGVAPNYSDAPWSTASLTLPDGLLTPGTNTIVIQNLEPAANFNSPPYILLSDTVLRFDTAP